MQPRFLDYRRNPLPLKVALSFAKPISLFEENDSEYKNDIDAGVCNIGSSSGFSSTRGDLILSGRVYVNDQVETNCHRLVCRNDDCISVHTWNYDEDDDAPSPQKKMAISKVVAMQITMPKYYICYKPRGVVCSAKRNEGIDRTDSILISEWLSNVIHEHLSLSLSLSLDKRIFDNYATTLKINSFCGEAKTIKTVGRLDEESEGLILLTNDGSFSRLLCDPEFGLHKTYRVVVKGSGYSRLMNSGISEEQFDKNLLLERLAEMIKLGNQHDETSIEPRFPYESCTIIDAGKLPTQHISDDRYYALVDLVLAEGKRHAVRRIIKNAGSMMRVVYLSRIAVEGCIYDVVKPTTISEAQEMGFLPVDGKKLRMEVPTGKLLLHSDYKQSNSSVLLNPGDMIELRKYDVDRIFHLRSL